MLQVKPARARELALASRGASLDATDGLAELELDSWQPFSRSTAEGFVGSTGKKVILAFRGAGLAGGDYDTLTWLDKMFTEWPANLNLAPKQLHSGQVHGGYLDHLRGVWPDVSRLLTDHGAKDKKLWIAGHGVGGGLAALAGALCHWENDLEVAGVCTFGAPKVADTAFARHYPVPLLRFEYRNDIVPHLPPNAAIARLLRVLSADIDEALDRWFGSHCVDTSFAPLGQLQYLTRKGTIHDEANENERLEGLVHAMIADPSQLLHDHWIDSYCAALAASA